jgi:hypothetical protein
MEQALVLVAAMAAVVAEQRLVPATAPRYVGDRDQRLRMHAESESKPLNFTPIPSR